MLEREGILWSNPIKLDDMKIWKYISTFKVQTMRHSLTEHIYWAHFIVIFGDNSV